MAEIEIDILHDVIHTVEIIGVGPQGPRGESGAAGSGVVTGTIDQRPAAPEDGIIYIATDVDEVYAYNPVGE